MNGQPRRFAELWLAHVRELAEVIGPRGSTTDAERRGSDYCRGVLDGLGLAPKVEMFPSARSIYHPHLLAALGMLAAFAIYPLAGRFSAGIAAVVSLVAYTSDLMELGFRDNLLRRLVRKGMSQNVLAVVHPRGKPLQDLVLIGHVDSHRSPIFFSSLGWLVAYAVFLKIVFVVFTSQIILYLVGIVTQWTWIWPTTFVSAICAAAMAIMCFHADRTPFSPGANDNATGAGLVLALGKQLSDAPLEHTRVWFVCSGCEEVQHYGAIDFFRRHKSDLLEPLTVVFESMGCDGPAWLTKEGIIIPFHADPDLVALAEEVANQHPEWGAYPTQISGGNTEMADALRAGIPAISLCGITRKGLLPYWHQTGDTFDKIDLSILIRAYAFTSAYLEAVDRRGERLGCDHPAKG